MLISMRLAKQYDIRDWSVSYGHGGVVWERFTHDEKFNHIHEKFVISPAGDVLFTRHVNGLIALTKVYKHE